MLVDPSTVRDMSDMELFAFLLGSREILERARGIHDMEARTMIVALTTNEALRRQANAAGGLHNLPPDLQNLARIWHAKYLHWPLHGMMWG